MGPLLNGLHGVEEGRDLAVDLQLVSCKLLYLLLVMLIELVLQLMEHLSVFGVHHLDGPLELPLRLIQLDPEGLAGHLVGFHLPLHAHAKVEVKRVSRRTHVNAHLLVNEFVLGSEVTVMHKLVDHACYLLLL